MKNLKFLFNEEKKANWTSEESWIPLVLFWSLMIIGGVIDCIRVGREGIGGLLILSGGILSYFYLLFVLIIGWDMEWAKPALIFSLPLVASGMLFYTVAKRQSTTALAVGE